MHSKVNDRVAAEVAELKAKYDGFDPHIVIVQVRVCRRCPWRGQLATGKRKKEKETKERKRKKKSQSERKISYGIMREEEDRSWGCKVGLMKT